MSSSSPFLQVPHASEASAFIALVSSEGVRLYVKRESAFVSSTIRDMDNRPGGASGSEIREVQFRDVPSFLLSKVCDYFAYRDAFSGSARPWTLQEFAIHEDLALPLLRVAHFLNC